MSLRSESKWNTRVIPEAVLERAATKWVLDGDCWISTYSRASHGYAQVGWGSRPNRGAVLAHRASWEYHMGRVPIGYTLDHLCKQKPCVNPAHLRVLPNFENARRTAGRDWPLGQCVNGHSNEHLRVFPDGRRHCWICATTVWRSALNNGEPRKVRVKKIKEPVVPKPPKTHCVRGHEWKEGNHYVRPSGRSECNICKQLAAVEWRLKSKT